MPTGFRVNVATYFMMILLAAWADFPGRTALDKFLGVKPVRPIEAMFFGDMNCCFDAL